jgi:two-component system alkaline phosphatase synthesis response regulator PhoP
VYALESAGFEARGFADGEAFFAALAPPAPDLILLDIMLPGEDGIALLKRLRRRQETAGIPVILLTAKTAEYDRIRGLDCGADDYIAKPFSVLEVVARIRAVLRRTETGAKREGEDDALTVGSVALSAERRSVTAGGAEVALTYKEFELLHCLMRNRGVVLTRDKLLERVWGYDYAGESRTVDMHVKSLRQKLGESGNVVKTVRNVGYKIEGG